MGDAFSVDTLLEAISPSTELAARLGIDRLPDGQEAIKKVQVEVLAPVKGLDELWRWQLYVYIMPY